MTRVINLVPGDLVAGPGGYGTYVAQTPHPLWPRLQLVVWRLADGTWSHDALSPAQDVGKVAESTDEDRRLRLRIALLGGGDPR